MSNAHNTLESLAAEIAAKTGAPIEAARAYIQIALRNPSTKAAILDALKGGR